MTSNHSDFFSFLSNISNRIEILKIIKKDFLYIKRQRWSANNNKPHPGNNSPNKSKRNNRIPIRVFFRRECLIKFSCHVASQSADLFEGYATDSKFITDVKIYGETLSSPLHPHQELFLPELFSPRINQKMVSHDSCCVEGTPGATWNRLIGLIGDRSINR